MIWLMHFIIVASLFLLSKKVGNKNFYTISIFIYITFIFGQRWMTGEDFPGYLLYYLINFQGTEYGYDLIQEFFVSNKLYFGLLVFLIYLITQINFFNLFRKFEQKDLLIFLYCLMEIFFMEMSQIRQWLAISFFVNSFYYIYTNKKIKAIIFLLIGASFHSSILFLIPFLIFKPKLKLNIYLFMFSICLILPFINIKLFLGPFEDVFYSNYFDSVYDVKLGFSHSIRYYTILFLTLFYLYRIKIDLKRHLSYQIINGHLLYFILYGLSFYFAPFMRLSYFFKVYEIFFLIYFIPYITVINKTLIKRLVVCITLSLYLVISILDPYNITRYEFRMLQLHENKSKTELFSEIELFYLN
ncbi:EpsG family protein [Planococcus sp. YIM B11945]|uniref:EpsG family protein n=1 Tax=Planococcus sp. YIM B11945 TaxID=3435410 RepID=UPI003D7D0461